MLEKINDYLFEKEYQYGEMIQNLARSPHAFERIFLSRVTALAISVISAAALIYDVVYMTVHSFNAIVFALRNEKSPIAYASNFRTILVAIAEFARNILGTVAGTLVGL